MLFEVYAEKEKKRVSLAGAIAEPKIDTIQLQAVASQTKTISSSAKVFSPTLSTLSKITNDFDKYASTPESQKLLKKRVDIV